MQTKSIIQLTKEAIERQEAFRDSISFIMNKYIIEDSVFIWNNGLVECTEGYFEVIGEYKNLNEAIKEVSSKSYTGIRILNNTDFQVGIIHTKISECNEDNKIFDIKRLEIIR